MPLIIDRARLGTLDPDTYRIKKFHEDRWLGIGVSALFAVAGGGCGLFLCATPNLSRVFVQVGMGSLSLSLVSTCALVYFILQKRKAERYTYECVHNPDLVNLYGLMPEVSQSVRTSIIREVLNDSELKEFNECLRLITSS